MFNKKVLYSLKNSDFKVIEYEDVLNNKIRALASGDVFYSVTSIKDKNTLYYNYLKLYDLPVIIHKNVKKSLVLGGGCFTYPKYYISKYNNKNMDVVEIDKEIIDISFKYFFLDDLYEEFDKNRKRLKIFNEDAYDFVKKYNSKYDYIFLDVFNKDEVIDDFLSSEFTKYILKILDKNGIFAINYIINKDKEPIFYSYIDTLKTFFKNIEILTINDEKTYNNNLGNVFIMCSKNNMDINIKTDLIISLNDKYLK